MTSDYKESNYLPIIRTNLTQAFAAGPARLATRTGGRWEDQELVFPALGGQCRITADTVTLHGRPESGPRGVILSLYLNHATEEPPRSTPWRAFVELPDSRPYVGAFTSHCETPLVPYVAQIEAHQEMICDRLGGRPITGELGGDLALALTPVPKIPLAYLFYRADEDFPASVKCLFSRNADRFMPVDGLADLGEYTSKTIIELLNG